MISDWDLVLLVLGKIEDITIVEDAEDGTIIARHKHGQGDACFTFDANGKLLDLSTEA